VTALSILHVSTSDGEGGSARSARRLHETLRGLGHVSRMLVGTKTSQDGDVDTVHGAGVVRLGDRLAEETTRRLGLQYLWYPSMTRVLRHPWLGQADVVQLYNTHGGYFSHRLLPALAQRAPLVWRLSDMWALTGHCAYSGACGRWREGCGACPDLAAYPPLPYDTTALLWRIKRRAVLAARPAIVAPSRWLAAYAREAPILAGCTVHHIANGVDRAIYRPLPKEAAREALGLSREETLVLFSAHVLDDNTRKGSAAAIDALRRIGRRDGLRVVLLGLGGTSWQGAIPQPITRLGFLRDDRLLAAAYASADLALAPSAVENLPNSVLEAMACGTPVVAFDAGGMRDAVRPGETGWLAPVGDVDALTHGLAALLDDGALRTRLGEASSAMIEREFDVHREAGAFVARYARRIEQRRREAA
jgi:glycosyltransferase involved in cell wall biosynthesis